MRFGWLLGFAWACGGDKTSTSDGPVDADTDTDADSDADVDADTDADTDADSDADTDADTDTDPGHSATTDSGTDTHTGLPPVCPEVTLAGAGTVQGDTTAAADDTSATCGGRAGRDVVVAFTPDWTGPWVINTVGSSFDTVLSARDGDCAGAERACDDDTAGDGRSSLTLDLVSGVPVYLVVDGNTGTDQGPFLLNASRACADFLLPGTLPTQGLGDTSGAPNNHAGSCAGSGASDALWLWTAPAAGTWTFDTRGSGYDTALYVFDGCTGPELACNDDIVPNTQRESEVTVTVTAGQTLVFVVDGFSSAAGPYTLNGG